MFWMKRNDEVIVEDKVYRAKELVDVALSLYFVCSESSQEEVFKHIESRRDIHSGIVYFYFLTGEIKEKFLEIRECKANGNPIAVDDYYKCSHYIGILKRSIRSNRSR